MNNIQCRTNYPILLEYTIILLYEYILYKAALSSLGKFYSVLFTPVHFYLIICVYSLALYCTQRLAPKSLNT